MPRTILPPEDRKSQILAAATAVFARKGFGGTKIADIAEAAGVAQGLLYRYFSSKETLFVTLIEESFLRLDQAIEGLSHAPLNGGQKLSAAVSGLLQRLVEDETFAQRVLLMAQASIPGNMPEDIQQAAQAARGGPYEALAAIIAEGQDDGSVVEGAPQQLSVLFWTVVKGLALHRLTFGVGGDWPDDALVGRLFLKQPDEA